MNKLIINGYICSGGGSYPEQWGVFEGANPNALGYMRLRYGRFTAQLSEDDPPLVEICIGDAYQGAFEDEQQRLAWLAVGVDAIRREREK